jgi:hypothetical protein
MARIAFCATRSITESAIAKYDPTSARVDWILGTGQNRTHMIYVTRDQQQIYTTNVASGTVSILEKVALPRRGLHQE